MKKIFNNSIISLIARLVLGWFFIYAAIGKIAEPTTFAKEIANYAIMPQFFLNIIALTMPWIELVTGIFLIVGIRLKANAAIIGLMLVVFIVAVFSAMARGLDINCGCFSHKIVYVGWGKIAENAGLLLLSLYIFVYPLKKFSMENLARNEK